jgi:hypothetical protein
MVTVNYHLWTLIFQLYHQSWIDEKVNFANFDVVTLTKLKLAKLTRFQVVYY